MASIYQMEPLEFTDLILAAMVDISVGPSETPFRLPRELLCWQSGFFHTAFHGDFKEATEARLTLPDVEPQSFAKVVKWMYQERLNDLVYIEDGRDLNARGDFTHSSLTEAAKRSRECFQGLLELYYLAEKLCMDVLKHQICQQLREIMLRGIKPRTLAPSTILNAYQNTTFTTTSPLWGLICWELATQLQGAPGRPMEDYQECFDTISGLAVRVMKEVQKERIKTYHYPVNFVDGQM